MIRLPLRPLVAPLAFLALASCVVAPARPYYGGGGYYGQPGYVGSQPVYMAPAPVYVAPSPVYVAPPPTVVLRLGGGGGYHDHHDHHDHGPPPRPQGGVHQDAHGNGGNGHWPNGQH